MLHLLHLVAPVRHLMAEEIALDQQEERLYFSPRLTTAGRAEYPELLRRAALEHDDGWLAGQLSRAGLLVTTETRRTRNGTTRVKVPYTAPQTLAEGEFNRFYGRALCRYALENGVPSVLVYRAKAVDIPRPESEARIGRNLDALTLLNDLRTHLAVDPALGVPAGPNSGLSIRLA